MLQHILSPDIKNEGNSRPERRDIAKILLRANTQVDAAGLCRFFQLGNEGSKFAFVRHVLEPKGAGVFGEVGHHSPEGAIRDLDGKSIGRFEREWIEQHGEGEHNEPIAAANQVTVIHPLH